MAVPHHPELIEDTMADADCLKILHELDLVGNQRALIELSNADSAPLLIDEARLSQRAYKYIRRSLRTKNVLLAR